MTTINFEESPETTLQDKPETISVIICAYTEKRWEDIKAAVKSVQEQTLTPDQVILVIDHNPALLERARTEFQGQPVSLIENEEKQGLSGARNSGVRAATGEIVVFLDDDAIAWPGWLAELCRPFSNARVLGTGGTVQPLWQTSAPAWFPEEFLWVVGCSYRGLPREVAPIRNPIGASMAFRRKIVVETGGFRSEIGRVGTRPVGCEETELCIRARQAYLDGMFLYLPEAIVQHRVPDVRGKWKYFRERCYAEGLSKALVTQLVGANSGLSSERSYTMKILPTGVLGGLRSAIFKRDIEGLKRAGAIVAGLFVTTFGYGVGRISNLRNRATNSKVSTSI